MPFTLKVLIMIASRFTRYFAQLLMACLSLCLGQAAWSMPVSVAGFAFAGD